MAAILGAIGPLLGGIGSLFGNSAANKASNAQASLLQQEQQQNQLEQMLFEQLFGQLSPFYKQYMSNGSPILNQVQRQSAEQTAQQYNQAGAQTAQRINTTGYGMAPTGTAAASWGDTNRAAAGAESTNFLNNLLANENLKFQAASGLGGMYGATKPNQGMPAGAQPSALPGALSQLGTGISDIFNAAGYGNPPKFTNTGFAATPAVGSLNPTDSPMPSTLIPPSGATQGFIGG